MRVEREATQVEYCKQEIKPTVKYLIRKIDEIELDPNDSCRFPRLCIKHIRISLENIKEAERTMWKRN